MKDKEQIVINGVDVGGCKHYEKHTFYDCNETCEDNGAIVCTNCKDNPNCYFKQLQKEKFENLNNKQIVESAENLIYENSELYKNLKEKEQECEELKKQDYENLKIIQDDFNQIKSLRAENARYLKALEEIEEIIKNDFRDDYKVGGVLTLINSYLTENGEFVDERGDFLKAFEDLLDKEYSSGNKTLSISRQILDIINKAKDGE